MNKMLATFLLKFTFQRQLGIAIALGIFLLALFSSVVGSWQGNQRVRGNLLEQGRHITESLARQSALALIYASADNAADAVSATLDFPGVVGVEIRDDSQRVLLKRGNTHPAEFPTQVFVAAGTGKTGGTQAAAVLDAENPTAWRFVAPVYSRPASSPFDETAAPEFLGYVTVVVSKAALTQMTTGIFVANLSTSFSFAFLFLFLIRFLADRMTQPLNQLSAIMGRAEAGESQVRAVLAGPQDIADMAHAFNSMMSVLEARAAEIRQLNRELERRVAERTAQLELANKELEAFSYSVSHDLRSPLRHIDGFLGLLNERVASTLDTESQHYLSSISKAARRMAALIDDILSFSRMGRAEMAKSQVDLGDLAREVIRELEPETHGRIIDWRIADLPVVAGDRAMLRVALVNLVSNALKFTQPRAQAEIEIGCLRGDEAETIIFVRDNGVGFDMRQTDKLFGVFQRLHRQDEFEGTGIGLANVRRVIGRHGGRTWAEGKVDGGATFYFSLPPAANKEFAGESQ